MTTLYKRATPAQARILRAVAGAVKNVMDHHPGRELDEYMARSIAKRACGTITSQMVIMSPEIELLKRRIISHIKINEDSKCWEAQSDPSCGYAKIIVNKKRKLLHRVSYETFVGVIPHGYVVRHTCDNKSCCNPDHLITGTHQQNAQDKTDRGRNRWRPLRGMDSPRTKLSDDDIAEILKKTASNAITAARFGVSESLIQQIRAKTTRRYLWSDPEVLAAKSVKGFVPSEKAGLLGLKRPANGSSYLYEAGRVSAHVVKPKPRGALKMLHRRSPLRLLQRDIGIMAGQARREGNTERLAALAEVLRMISVIAGQS